MINDYPIFFFFFSSRRRHTRSTRDWSSDVCSSDLVSGYKIGFNGGLQLLNATGVTASTGAGSTPLDAAFSNDGRFLYVLTPGTNNIQGFSLSSDGSLTPLTQVTGSPSSASGLVAR